MKVGICTLDYEHTVHRYEILNALNFHQRRLVLLSIIRSMVSERQRATSKHELLVSDIRLFESHLPPTEAKLSSIQWGGPASQLSEIILSSGSQ